MVETVITWCGLISAIGASLFVLGVGIEFFHEQTDKFWSALAKNYTSTKAWILFKRVQRRYVK